MCKTIHQTVTFSCKTKNIYLRLVPARARVGGRFRLRRGRISGVHVDLQAGVRWVLAWRDQKFAPGVFSMVTILLTPTARGGTRLKLIHRGVPKEHIALVEREWRQKCWDPLKRSNGRPW